MTREHFALIKISLRDALARQPHWRHLHLEWKLALAGMTASNTTTPQPLGLRSQLARLDAWGEKGFPMFRMR